MRANPGARLARVDVIDELHAAPGADIGLRLDLVAALQKLPIDQREPLLLQLRDLHSAQLGGVVEPARVAAVAGQRDGQFAAGFGAGVAGST